MARCSYSDVFDVQLDRAHDEEILVGDLVRTGTNLFPHYEVIAVSGDKAWLRDSQNGVDHLASTTRLRKVEPAPLAMAAE
jgi:hypothetical protein